MKYKTYKEFTRELVNEALSAKSLVTKIIKGNKNFRWLKSDLPKNYSLKNVEDALANSGYSNVYTEYMNESINEAKYPKTIKVIKSIWLKDDDTWSTIEHERDRHDPMAVSPGTEFTFKETGPGYAVYYDIDDDGYKHEFTLDDLSRLKQDRSIKI